MRVFMLVVDEDPHIVCSNIHAILPLLAQPVALYFSGTRSG